jgi:predicted molibdopterin-dependent oxidoreductase YjgC
LGRFTGGLRPSKVRLKDHPILDFSAGQEVAFTFDGNKLKGIDGEPIAAALHANGVRVLRHSPVSGRARGFFCAIGNCSSCLMTVDGVPNVRVCTEPLREGMVVETQKGHGQLPID